MKASDQVAAAPIPESTGDNTATDKTTAIAI
jgi:hypothetical protein